MKIVCQVISVKYQKSDSMSSSTDSVILIWVNNVCWFNIVVINEEEVFNAGGAVVVIVFVDSIIPSESIILSIAGKYALYFEVLGSSKKGLLYLILYVIHLITLYSLNFHYPTFRAPQVEVAWRNYNIFTLCRGLSLAIVVEDYRIIWRIWLYTSLSVMDHKWSYPFTESLNMFFSLVKLVTEKLYAEYKKLSVYVDWCLFC